MVLSIVFPACKPHFSWVCLSLHVEIWLPIIPSPGILVFLGWNPSALFGKTDTWCSSMSPWAGGVGSWEVSSKGRSPSLLIISFSPGSLSIQKGLKLDLWTCQWKIERKNSYNPDIFHKTLSCQTSLCDICSLSHFSKWVFFQNSVS